jgi:hypothetical protein
VRNLVILWDSSHPQCVSAGIRSERFASREVEEAKLQTGTFFEDGRRICAAFSGGDKPGTKLRASSTLTNRSAALKSKPRGGRWSRKCFACRLVLKEQLASLPTLE